MSSIVSTCERPRVVQGAGSLLDLWPPVPTSVAATGLPLVFVEELALKTIFAIGTCSLDDLVGRTCLSAPVVEEIVGRLSRLGQVEPVTDMDGEQWPYASLRRQVTLTERGQQRLAVAQARSRYCGAAPVPIDQYVRLARLQSVRASPLDPDRLSSAIEPFVLQPAVRDGLVRAFHAGRPVLVYGETGNGKTSILDAYSRAFGHTVLAPQALYTHGQVIRVFDEAAHRLSESAGTFARTAAATEAGLAPLRSADRAIDRRWQAIVRPVIFVGGELAAQSLELRFDAAQGAYDAPAHVKAQNGIFVIDDFGRQKIRPEDLLNRWIVPLERGYDVLALESGEAATIPFETCVLLSTNLSPVDLVDEALLRRIPYKVHIPNPGAREIAEITRRECERRDIWCDESAVQVLVRALFQPGRPAPKGVFPRDLLSIIEDSARFRGNAPAITEEAVEEACQLYFVVETA